MLDMPWKRERWKEADRETLKIGSAQRWKNVAHDSDKPGKNEDNPHIMTTHIYDTP